MIRINLLAEKDTARRRRAVGPGVGTNIIALFGMVLVLELAGLGYWYMEVEAAADNSSTGQTALRNELSQLETVESLKAKVDKLSNEVEKQQQVFDELRYAKVGPLNALLYISYALRKVDMNMNQHEYQVLSTRWSTDQKGGGEGDESDWKAGGNEEWNPQTIWLQSLTEKDGLVQIEGSAKRHEDVMTFLQRLRTSVYFEGVDLMYQKVHEKSDLGLPYIDFKLQCIFNFYPQGFPPLAVSGEDAH
jgi:Tfp pilus assembly protein PilN